MLFLLSERNLCHWFPSKPLPKLATATAFAAATNSRAFATRIPARDIARLAVKIIWIGTWAWASPSLLPPKCRRILPPANPPANFRLPPTRLPGYADRVASFVAAAFRGGRIVCQVVPTSRRKNKDAPFRRARPFPFVILADV